MKFNCLLCCLLGRASCHACKTFVEEAPRDGKLYGRKDRQWEEITGGGGERVQADWEQEDAAQPDYVKNRPQINEVILIGNRVLPDTPITNLEIEELLSGQWLG